MNDFVERCRREWARLRVPEPVAEEMAADLAADLREADAEGVSPEEVLGSGAFDPRSFAASWAAERGVIPPVPARQHQSVFPRPLVLAAFAVLAFVVLSFVALFGAVVITRAAPPAVSVARTAPPHFRPLQPGPAQQVVVQGHSSVGAAPLLLLLLLLAIIAIVIAWLWSVRTCRRPPSASV